MSSNGQQNSNQTAKKSLRQQYQDVIGVPPLILGENKLPAVADVLRQGFNSLPITTWVVVSPQVIARLHSSSAQGSIRILIQELLLMIGQYHPQALVYPLTVAVKSEQQNAQQTVKSHVLSVAVHRGLTIYGPAKRNRVTAGLSNNNPGLTSQQSVYGNIGMVHDYRGTVLNGPNFGPNFTNLPLSQQIQQQQSQPQQQPQQPQQHPNPNQTKSKEDGITKRQTMNTALQVMASLRQISPLLIEQAMVVSRELIRAAVLWHEIWHEALEEASRLWFTQQDPFAMLALLLPLHQKMGLGSHSNVQLATARNYNIPTGNNISQLITTLPSFQINDKTASTAGAFNFGAHLHQNFFGGPETPREIAFIHVFGRELSLAHDWCMKYLSHLADEEFGIDASQMWYDGDIICKLKKDLEGYQPGVQLYHPHRHGIQAMNDFIKEQYEFERRTMYSHAVDIFSEPVNNNDNNNTQNNNTTKNNNDTKPTNKPNTAAISSPNNTPTTPQKKCVPYASDLNQAWAIYCTVFRNINKMISQGGESSQFFELHDVSPILLSCQDLVLAIPGTYDPKRSSMTVSIARVISHFKVIESKQRPRKLSIIGSDGQEHPFLLKGHEDLRQDTRVMQLFDLVNALLSSSNNSNTPNNTSNLNEADSSSGSTAPSGANSATPGGSSSGMGLGSSSNTPAAQGSQNADLELNLRGYSVTPLSPVSGVIQWLSNCDTLHALIKDYRDARFVLISAENKLMGQVSSNCQTVKLLQKVEVFEHALSNTTGRDLADVLWLRASTSEQWLERRNNYTRSLAVTSIVGYILGLGDRHPCNLMLERTSAKVIHIDFGDCFEVAQHREKFPERVPFRLTRILVRALEVSGIEGTFRLTCEHVMQTLRSSKESVMAVLEAFIYDPLITWRLLSDGGGGGGTTNIPGQPNGNDNDDETDNETSPNDNKDKTNNNDGQTTKPLLKPSMMTLRPQLPPNIQALVNDISKAINNTVNHDDRHDASSTMFNTKALAVIDRIESKLNGTDFHGRWNSATQQRNKRVVKDKIKCLLGFGLEVVVTHDGWNKKIDDQILSAPHQVELLIILATNSQVLSNAYSGWCPYL
jgi:hypothetical protein